MKKKTTKAKAKKPSDTQPIEPRIVKAAMELAAQKGWAEVSSAEVAKRAKLPVDEVRLLCPDKTDVLKLLAEEINLAMLEGGEVDGSVRDNLFELVMRRLEAMQFFRPGILAVVEAVKHEPVILFRMAGTFHEALGHVLDMAGLEPSPLRRIGFAPVALAVFRVWCEDESDDLAATMAELDRRLGQLERVAEAFSPLLNRAA